MSLPSKLFLVYIPLIVLPLVFGFIYLTSTFITTHIKTETEYSKELLGTIADKIDDRVTVFEAISYQLFWAPEVQEFLQKRTGTPYEIIGMKERIKDRVDTILSGKEKKYVRAVVILSSDQIYVMGDVLAVNNDWRPAFSVKPGRPEWFLPDAPEQLTPDTGFFRLARVVRNKKLEQIGQLYLVLDTRFVSDLFDETTVKNDAQYILATREGYRITGDEFAPIVRGRQPVLLSRNLQHNQWQVKVQLPMNRLYATIDRMIRLALWITLVCLGIGLAATYLLTVDTIVPIRKLMVNLKQGIKGKSPSLLKKFRGAKEVVELNDTFISVMYEIQRLIQEVMRTQTLQRNAELKALQNQLSPHFLYNTLNTIRWMALLQNQPNIREIVDSLSQLLNYSMKDLNQRVTLTEETNAIHSYVTIQRARFKNFEFIVEIPDEAKSLYIIKFLIQPLIENALMHGLIQTDRDGIIRLQAKVKNNHLLIEVSDNGIGLSPEELLKVNRMMESGQYAGDGREHIGLRNVNERIRLHYGHTYGIKFDSMKDVGTRITIVLPLEEGTADEDSHDRG